jgi:hypothetical protein
MNQKEKSQLGSVAMIMLWFGKHSGYRNITNAALEDSYVNSVRLTLN